MSKRTMTWALFVLGAILLSGPASAQVLGCQVDPAPALDFGSPQSNPTQQVDTAASVRVTCDGFIGQEFKVCVGISNGAPDPALSPYRRMANGAARLQYQIYADPARTQVVGTRSSGGGATPAQGTLVITNNLFFGYGTGSVDIPIYGRIPAGQAQLAAGIYTSTMAASEIHTSTNLNRACNSINDLQGNFVTTARADLSSSCIIDANNLSFGTRNRLNTAVDATTTIGLTCSVGTLYTVRLNGGDVGNVAARRMALNGTGAGIISYQLRHTSANGPLWGDGTGNTGVVTGTGTGSSQTLPVYGRVPVQPTPAVGYYEDTVTATVEY